MAKHRILILTNRIPYPLNDGGSLAMHAMIEGLHKAGWAVYLLSMNTSRHYVAKEVLPPLFSQIEFETFDINTDVKLVPTLMNFFFSRKPNHAERFYERDFDKKLKEIILDFEPEIIQLESIYLSTYIPSIRDVTKAKVSIRLHNIEYQIWERLANDAPSFRRYYIKDLASRIRRFEINAWSQADILVPISDTDALIVESHTSGKEIATAPFGIELPKQPNAKGNEKWVGYHIGAMDWMPNVEAITWFLEEVWPDLHREIPQFEFYFAGRNMPGSFEKFEHDKVTCEGEVASASAFTSDKKILIVPLRSAGGIRVKTIQAMAEAKVVISTSIGMTGISAAVPNAHFLPAEDKEDFVNKIKWVLDNKEKAQEIGHAAAELVRREYDQDRIMKALIKRLLEALRN
jgi:polysaccharide biosynthesis protein PslH